MRTKVTMLLGAIMLLFGVLSFAQPVAAAPAQPYNNAYCFDLGDGYEYCYQAKGVSQENTSKSGITNSTFNGTSSYTITLDNEVVYSGSSKEHYTFITEDGEAQVSHQRESGSFGTCTYDVNVIYANGEVRHAVENFSCS